jgi:hypothetical protein
VIEITNPCKAWIAAFLMVALFTPISAAWFDRPIALWIYDTFGSQHASVELAASPVLSVPLIAAAVFVICGILAIMRGRFSQRTTAVLLCDISTLAAGAIKNELKLAFGRTWPDSWKSGILSLVHDGAYGFHPFQSGQSFESFPSGHAAVAAAVMSVLWILFPKRRALWATAIVAADVGLVALNVHFLSDVVAGTFVGVSTGWLTVALWRASAPASRLFAAPSASSSLPT